MTPQENMIEELRSEVVRLKELNHKDIFECPSCSEKFGKDNFKSFLDYDDLKAKLKIAVEALTQAKITFEIIRVQPREPLVTAYDYQSIYERDQRDAFNGIRDILAALQKLNEVK